MMFRFLLTKQSHLHFEGVNSGNHKVYSEKESLVKTDVRVQQQLGMNATMKMHHCAQHATESRMYMSLTAADLKMSDTWNKR